jgi:transglutaminase-like putative cysteine protease
VFLEITHTTAYSFSGPVFLEPHTFRLRPRCDGSQHLIRFDLRIEPKPVGLSECLDIEGNCAVHAWFDGLTESLHVKTRCEVETLRKNPFDYIIHPPVDRLPAKYLEDLHLSVTPYCLRDSSDDAITQFANSIADEVDRQTIPFLAALSTRIFQTCEVMVREEGGPQTARATLAQQRGACRDLAVLFIDACRALGLGARFVSGYQQGDPDQDRRDLHAWAEVYLPGGGWRGYDPTHGLAVADRYVTVAAGRQPALAAPITGTFRGSGVSSRMKADIKISVSSGAER